MLAAALAALKCGPQAPPIDDVGRSLGELVVAVGEAVPSYCGLSMTMQVDGIPVTVTAADGEDGFPATHVMTSLVIPLPAVRPNARGELILFASAPGAFVDLAADLAYETATEPATFAVDTRLGASANGAVGMDGLRLINQAIGVLIEQGATPAQARARISGSATATGTDLATAAADMLAAVEL